MQEQQIRTSWDRADSLSSGTPSLRRHDKLNTYFLKNTPISSSANRIRDEQPVSVTARWTHIKDREGRSSRQSRGWRLTKLEPEVWWMAFFSPCPNLPDTYNWGANNERSIERSRRRTVASHVCTKKYMCILVSLWSLRAEEITSRKARPSRFY